MQGERVSRSRGSGKLGSGLWGKDEVKAGGSRRRRGSGGKDGGAGGGEGRVGSRGAG